MSKRILNIEDDRDLGNLIKLNLADFRVDQVPDGAAGLEVAMCGGYDLLILDLMLPGLDGVEVCRALRAANRTTPILMLTARDTEIDRVVGLEIGADDYLTKPFSVRELRARVKAILRRAEMQQTRSSRSHVMEFAGLQIDVDRRRVNRDGERVDLTSTEFDLLVHLAGNPGHVYSRSQLLGAVWGYHHAGYEHTVNSHINRLRQKIESRSSHPEYVLTVWGVGYKFAEDKQPP
jgi:DNA-binding response OmpR family regulator